MSRRAVFCLAILAAAAAQASAADFYYYVGGDGACDFADLQQAIDAVPKFTAEPVRIMVTNSASYAGQELAIVDRSVSLEGGYMNCIVGAPDPAQPRTELAGTGVHPVVIIGATVAGDYDIRLQGLDIHDGGYDFAGPVGGGVHVAPGVAGANLTLRIADSSIRENHGSSGGGIRAMRPAVAGAGNVNLILEPRTRIHGNTASHDGGGIDLRGANLWIAAHDVRIDGNVAAERGGGLAVGAGNVMVGNVYPGSWPARTDVIGARIEGNAAGAHGGGIALGGEGATLMVASELIVDGNTAGLSGGGVRVEPGATFIMRRDVAAAASRWTCRPWLECSRISGNLVGDGTTAGLEGGGLAAVGPAMVGLYQAIVRDNRAQAGPALFLSGAAQLDTEGVVFAGNRGQNIPSEGTATIRARFEAPDGRPDVRFAFTTFRDNVVVRVDGTVGAAFSFIGDPAGTDFAAYSSVFLDESVPWAVFNAHTSDCTLLRAGGLLPGTGTHTRSSATGAPVGALFVSPRPGEAHPRFDAPLVDFCDTSAYVPRFLDRDLRPRCHDDAEADRYGSCDLGALETDQLFADGLE